MWFDFFIDFSKPIAATYITERYHCYTKEKG